jgi:hypothetical protein
MKDQTCSAFVWRVLNDYFFKNVFPTIYIHSLQLSSLYSEQIISFSNFVKDCLKFRILMMKKITPLLICAKSIRNNLILFKTLMLSNPAYNLSFLIREKSIFDEWKNNWEKW